MSTAANRDVWSEILRYLRISLADDKQVDLLIKKRTILAIAFTCSNIAEVALDELWRSMVSLEPIVGVFNASSPSSTGILECRNQDYWEICQLSANDVDSCVFKARSYLSRIRYLHFSAFPTHRERMLWQALYSLGRFSSLCPNLQRIFLGLGNVSPGLVYNFTTILSPSLRGITFANCQSEGSDGVTASMILRMLKHRNVDLLEISYNGFASSRVVDQIFQFPSLTSIGIQCTVGHLVVPENFQPLPHLTKLDINLGVSFRTGVVGTWIAGMQSLADLRLCGSWQDMYHSTIFSNILMTVQSLTLCVAASTTRTLLQTNIFSDISNAFPGLRSLCLDLIGSAGAQPRTSSITLADILLLRDRSIEYIDFRYISTQLSTTDVIDIITVWPSLKGISIIPLNPPGNPPCDAKALFSYISRHAPCLHHLNVPLNTLALAAGFPMTPGVCVCPLQNLDLSQTLPYLPSTLLDKLTFARNLISLFPRLTTVASSGIDSGDRVKDLQTIINALQDVVSYPPQRLDILFRS
ncbi:hypothetical protein P691DRAFT_760293 [Macrolepiota fuliginosa MF-IS2]|uniref:RNI-like protein n=1 Tax=Macrolepiota fuliginosa MF-IS2 TaxID=1400762 RepID=A0A9P5XC47_9AGAR|nr:hypothetical protein P691DRAFT_760293 [Macrolepiota fuliginosa MF-IS2]